MGRRLSQYLRSLGDDGRPTVVFVFDDEEAPTDAEWAHRLNLTGEPALRCQGLACGLRCWFGSPAGRRLALSDIR
jgi:hypothetical protein